MFDKSMEKNVKKYSKVTYFGLNSLPLVIASIEKILFTLETKGCIKGTTPTKLEDLNCSLEFLLTW